MASGLFSSIQSLSTKLLHAIRGTTITSHQHDPVESVREDLEKLSRMIARIEAVQQDAEEREIHDRSVRLWLEELRGVAYQAEDLLDDFHYEVLRSIVESGDAAIEAYHRERGAKRKFAEMQTSSSLASYSFTFTKALIPDGMAEKIKGITERFQEISSARSDLHLREEDGTRLVTGLQIRQPTSSHVDERAIFGREEEKEKIIGLLNPSNDLDFIVLPIVAMGGFGKTMLAQLVYNDSRIHELFNKRCWVSVSEDFDLMRLTKVIVDSLSEKPFESSELSKLQDVLKEKIRGHDLFLVLDDVWNEERDLWESFRVGFLSAKVVRILTTTRNTSVAKIMQTTSPFSLGSLPEENCWSLFKHFAFGNREASENAKLHKIGLGIVKKCKGSPLAIKALGGLLRYEMDEVKWREILESDISELYSTGEIMPALWLSYKKLPRHLKPCFLYLSMFPKNTPFEKDMVIRLWMAQGYIKSNTRNLKTLEEIGSEYFNELHGRSLVECGPVTEYLLHDLIHDLARAISQEAYRPILENDQQYNDSCKVYHLYVTKQDKFLSSLLAPNNYLSVRTFVKEYPRSRNFEHAIFSEIACARALQLRYSLLPNTLGMLKHLRYLSLKYCHMETLPEALCLLYNLQTLDLNSFYLREIPDNIKNLINLRYFQLNSSEIQQLPESIFLLRNLHTLSLSHCTKLKELPRGIEQLARLHILDLPVSLINMPSGIGKLTTLKPLSGHFSVMDHGMNKGLGELNKINKLSGLLWISGLKNISDVEYSRNANLASKANLHELILNFQEEHSTVSCGYEELHLNLVVHSSQNAKNENDENIQDVVLESLQPHGNLKELAILNYGGRTFPSWLLNPLLSKLTTLTLNFYNEPNLLPPFGRLPYLRFLKILGRTGVRDVGDERNTYSLLAEYGSSKQPKEPSYPSLEVLLLRNMLNLVEWQAHDGDFPCLKKLFIENCPKLWKIPIIPHKVREVTFNHCPKLKVLTCPSVIKKLKIHKCGFCEIMFGSISDSLIISKCIELISLNWIDGGLNSIRLVTFEYCPKLEVVTIPDGILTLIINKCGFREIMFRSISMNLTLSNCAELILINWMDGGLNSIKKVIFEYCPKLEVVNIPVGTLTLIINECGFREIMFQSISHILKISNCIELISINWMDGGLNSAREVSFEYCPKLELVTIPIRTLKLKIHECGFREIMFRSVNDNLTISNCVELISINWTDRGINSLRKVSFEYCPKLKLVTIPVRTLKLTINECGFHEIMFRLVSENLKISNCKELISINWMDGGLNLVREVSFEYCPKLELLTIPVRTRKLKIHECGLREIMFRSIYDQLTISNCKELILINWMDGCLNYVREVSFVSCPKLELLTIPVGTQKLKIHECGFREIMFWSVSIDLSISNCVELTSINWMNGSLISVKKVSFEYCPKLQGITIPVETLTLIINKCGIHEIIFQSVSEYLTISNCIELVSVNWMDKGLNSVRVVTFEYCPKLELISIPVGMWTLIINECGFREIMFQTVSGNLTISNCIELISINWMDGGLNYVREVCFDYCPKLKLLTVPVGTWKLKIHECGLREIMFRSIYEHLTISNCVELITINWMDDGLKSVREVNFEYCPKLELLTIPVGTWKLKIHECGFREIMFWSVSMNLSISNCIELISINWMNGGLNSVKKVNFEYCPKLEVITIPVETLTLIISECGFREIIFQSVSEYLTISNCIELVSVSWMNGGLNYVKAIAFEYCPKLELISIPVGTWTLIINECGFREIMFQSVSGYLTISNCIELISINWMDGSLNFVREVSFEYCPKLKLVRIPTGTLKLKIHECGFREIMFQSVSEYLTVSNCIDLISINWMHGGICYVREVSFKYCPKLKLQLPVNDVLHSMTQRVEIYDCPRMHLGNRYVYQRNTEIKELNLFGNNEIDLSHASVNSTIPLLENPFTLFLTKEDFREMESLTCAPSVGVSCQCVMLNLASLVILKILRCTKVISVAGLDNLSNLKHLIISYCTELCNWNDKTLPLSLEFLKLDSCDKLSSIPLLSIQNDSSTLKDLVIKKCPRLAVLEGFHGLMNLKTVELLHCGNISIYPWSESLQFRPRFTIGDCPLMRDWCQRNNITYYELIGNPQDDREAQLESDELESDEHKIGELESDELENGEHESEEQESDEEESGEQESDEQESDEEENGEQESDEQESGEQESDEQEYDEQESEEENGEQESDEEESDEEESEEEENSDQESGGTT